MLLRHEFLTDLAAEEEQQDREENQEDDEDFLLGKAGSGVRFGVTFLEAVGADTHGDYGKDEPEKEQAEEEVLALYLALDGLVLGALAGEIVGGLVVLGALLAGEEVLGVALNFQGTGDSGLEVGLEAVCVGVAVLLLAAADGHERTAVGGLAVADLALVGGPGVAGDDDDLGALEREVRLVEHRFH